MDENLGISAERARMLSAFFDLAERLIATTPGTRSVMLMCAQYWSDEADDAVQEETLGSPELVPSLGQRPDWSVVHEVLGWHANTDAVWAFSAMCNEEGWTEDDGTVNPELKNVYHYTNSPVMLVQHAGDHLRAFWLGFPLRAWLDAPAALQDREYGAAPVVVPDPPPPSLVGRERELYDQVLADPYDRGPREVLRDLWIERGDPRGDFCIATSRSEPEMVARAAELVAAHGRSWVGALQPVIPLSGALFGDGPFLRKAIVYAPDRAAFERVADAPEWGSIEEIVFAPQSQHRIVPRMRNVRAIGPVSPADAVAMQSWQVRDLDLELAGEPLERVASLRLPLRVLRLRQARTLDPSWLGKLSVLHHAVWWATLERLEIWLPGDATEPEETIRAFETALPALRDGTTLAVGVLSADQRTGWMLAGDRRERRLELVHPDSRLLRGQQLAELTGLDATPRLLELDNWLALALGVPSIRQLPAT